LHIIDAERIFQYRALRLLLSDTTPLPDFGQKHFVKYWNAATRSKESLI